MTLGLPEDGDLAGAMRCYSDRIHAVAGDELAVYESGEVMPTHADIVTVRDSELWRGYALRQMTMLVSDDGVDSVDAALSVALDGLAVGALMERARWERARMLSAGSESREA